MAAGLVLHAGVARGRFIAPGLDTAGLTDAADIVAAGRIARVTPTGRIQPAGTAPNQHEALEVGEATLDVAFVLKGAPSATRITFEFIPEALDPRGVALGEYRIFFLVRRGDRFGVVDDYNPSVAAVPGVTVPPEDTEPIDRVADLVGPWLVGPASTKAQKMDALWTLRWSRGPRTIDFLRRGVADSNDLVRLTAVGALLALHDTSQLALAEDVLMHPEQHTSDAVLAVRVGLQWGGGGPTAVPMLSRLMKSPDALTRRTAATLLFQVKSPDGVPALVGGLDDDDPEVRRMSTVGLSAITGEKPSIRLRGDSEAIENYWRAWARQRGLLP
ncbi:MAG TPA: HEAT repeat domain-containing protein [Vicinamibacterales bacterium]|jgi:hypothetical protein|nr:HEAT repeat domain-containing protein [Vicinamibacterales bacterium]